MAVVKLTEDEPHRAAAHKMAWRVDENVNRRGSRLVERDGELGRRVAATYEQHALATVPAAALHLPRVYDVRVQVDALAGGHGQMRPPVEAGGDDHALAAVLSFVCADAQRVRRALLRAMPDAEHPFAKRDALIQAMRFSILLKVVAHFTLCLEHGILHGEAAVVRQAVVRAVQ